MKSKLQKYLSLEDVSSAPVPVEAEVTQTEETVVVEIEIPAAVLVTDDEVEEAEAELDDLETEYLDDSHVLAVVEEAETVRESIENYIDVLKCGLDKKNYSVQTVALAHAALEHYHDMFNETVAIPALESYNQDQLEGYYTAALESFTGFLARVVRVIPAIINRKVDELVDKLDARSKARIDTKINKLADKAIAEASGKMISAKLKMKGREKVFGHATGLPTNIAKAVRQDQAAIQQFATKNVIPYFAYAEEVLRVVGDGIVNGGPSQTGKIAGKVLHIANPLKSITAEQTSGESFLRLRHVEVTTQSTGSSDELAKLNAAKKNTFLLERGNKPEAKFDAMEFTAQEVTELANLAKAYGVLVGKLITEFGKYGKSGEISKLFNNASSTQLVGAQLATWDDDKALDYAMSVGIYAQNYAIVNVLRVLDHVQVMGVEVAKLALKASKKLK